MAILSYATRRDETRRNNHFSSVYAEWSRIANIFPQILMQKKMLNEEEEEDLNRKSQCDSIKYFL